MDDQLTTKIVGIVAMVTRRMPDAIRPDATFDEQGIDSLDRINILFELEKDFDINIPDEDARGIKTVNEIVERMQAHWQRAEKTGA